MKVLYDHQRFSAQNYGGITRYFYELMNIYHLQSDISFNLSLYFSNNEYLVKSDFLQCKTFFENYSFKGKGTLLNFINQIKSISKLKNQEFDVFHPTYYDDYFLKYIQNKPFVITVHDMIHELYKDSFSKNEAIKIIEFKKTLIEKASKIISVSENTKKDILEIYNINPNKIDVVYHGSSFNLDLSINSNLIHPEKFILFVGQRSNYKNFNFFVESIAEILLQDKELFLVCAGGGKFDETELELLKKLSIDKKVRQINVRDNDLKLLYSKSLCFAFPSLYEGFGIPILEAFSCRCPVVLSNTSCLPEVAEESAEYFQPDNMGSIKSSIENVIYNQNKRGELILKGIKQLNKFSWEKAALETKAVYKSVL